VNSREGVIFIFVLNFYVEYWNTSNISVFLGSLAGVFSLFTRISLIVSDCTSNFSAIWWLSPLPVTGLQI
jgi:hypothetical protein